MGREQFWVDHGDREGRMAKPALQQPERPDTGQATVEAHTDTAPAGAEGETVVGEREPDPQGSPGPEVVDGVRGQHVVRRGPDVPPPELDVQVSGIDADQRGTRTDTDQAEQRTSWHREREAELGRRLENRPVLGAERRNHAQFTLLVAVDFR